MAGATLPEPRADGAVVVDGDEASAGLGVAAHAHVSLVEDVDAAAVVRPMNKVSARAVTPAARRWAALKRVVNTLVRQRPGHVVPAVQVEAVRALVN